MIAKLKSSIYNYQKYYFTKKSTESIKLPSSKEESKSTSYSNYFSNKHINSNFYFTILVYEIIEIN